MTVYKRQGSPLWQCEFIYQGKRYRMSTGCTTKTAAQAFEVKKRKEAEEDYEEARQGRQRMTLGELARQWLASSEVTHRDHKNNESRVRKLFGREKVKEGDKWIEKSGKRYGLDPAAPVHELCQRDMTKLRDARRREGNSGSTINREMSLVQSLMGYAKSLGVVMGPDIVWSEPRNKAASLKVPEGGGKLRWLREEEEAKLLRSLAAKAHEDHAALDAYHLTLLLLDTGARYSEIAGLAWSQVNIAAGTIDLFRSKVQNESLLKLPMRTQIALDYRRRELKAEGIARCSYVFPALQGRHWLNEDAHRGHATGAIQRHIDECGLNENPREDRVTPHTFRDTWASRLVQNGVSLQKVQHLLGHSDMEMTQKYAHLSPEAAADEAASVLDRLHAIKGPQGDDPMSVPTKVPDVA